MQEAIATFLREWSPPCNWGLEESLWLDYKARFIFEILIKEDVTACSPLGYPFTCSVFDAVTAFRGVTIVAFGRLRFPEAPRPGAGEESSHYNKLYFF